VKIIGIKIALGDCSITILQHWYLKSILYKEQMDMANLVGMLLDPKIMLKPNLDRNAKDCSNLYTRLISKLQFITNVTRPNIMYVVSSVKAIVCLLE